MPGCECGRGLFFDFNKLVIKEGLARMNGSVGAWLGNASHLCYKATSEFNASHNQVQPKKFSEFLPLTFGRRRLGVVLRMIVARSDSYSQSLTTSSGTPGSGSPYTWWASSTALSRCSLWQTSSCAPLMPSPRPPRRSPCRGQMGSRR